MVSKTSLSARYEFGDPKTKRLKLVPKEVRVFQPQDAMKLLDEVEFDHKVEPALKALDIIYDHSLQQDAKGEPLWEPMQAALDRILSMPKHRKFVAEDYNNLIRAALWLHIDRGTRDQSYQSAVQMLDFLATRKRSRLPIPALHEMAVPDEYKAKLDGDRVIRKADYWPLIWVKPSDRAHLLRHIADSNHFLTEQALETPLRQLVNGSFGRFKEHPVAAEKASLRDIYAMATKGAASNTALKELQGKMKLRHTNGNDYWLALDAA